MIPGLYIGDLFGTFIFALYGAFLVLDKRMRPWSVFLAALLTAVGGGTIRSLITQTVPFYITDGRYLIVVVLGFLCAYPTRRYFQHYPLHLDILDAIGMGVFAFIGANIAEQQHMGFLGVLGFAPLTAAGGGFIRDIFLLRKIPNLPYALSALLFGGAYLLCLPYMDRTLPVYALLLVFFILRSVVVFGVYVFDHVNGYRFDHEKRLTYHILDQHIRYTYWHSPVAEGTEGPGIRKMMQATFVCSHGGPNEYTNNWERQDPDTLAGLYNCSGHYKPMKVKQVINWTEKARGDEFTAASFSDMTESE